MSSHHLSSYKDTISLFTIFPIPYVYIYDSLILQLGTCTMIYVTYFFHLPTCLPSVNYLLVLCIKDFFYFVMLLHQFSSVQLLSQVQLFVTPWTAAGQGSLSITKPQSLLKLMPTESVMPSNHLILCHPFLLRPSSLLSIRVFSSKSALCIMWPKYWNFSFSIIPSKEYSGLISFWMDWLDLLADL